MGSPLTFRLAIAPTGKARPRAVIRSCKDLARRKRWKVPHACRAGVMSDKAYTKWKKHLTGLLCAQLILGKWPKATDPHRDAVLVTVATYHKRPAAPPSWMKGPERAAERAAWRAGWCPPRLAKPDEENMVGAIWDALSDTGLCWVDDHQAKLTPVVRTWAAVGEPAHIVVTLERVAWKVPPPEPSA